MQEKSLKVLEFYKIRDMLVERAASGLGKARCAALVPVSDIREIERMQAETEEASTLVARTGVQPISAFDDVQAQVARAKVGGILSPKDLLLCARLMQTARSVRRTLVGEKDEAEETETPHLVGLARALYPMRRLEEEIFAAILSEEEIADSASPGLASVRRKIRSANERIRDKLNGYLHSSSMARYLQDAIITMRQGRYVLPVRAEYRSQVPGIVHDQSSSGATLFIEPMAIVEINNDLRGLMGEERAEIEKILQRFSEEISQEAGALLENQRILAELDFIFAKGALARQMRAVQPKINETGYIDIKRGRHPLIDPEAVVPSDLWIGKDFTTLVVTGPNTGGKTVTLKTVGLFTLMMQAGLQVPAMLGTELAVFDDVFADIGDEQSIEQSLSTFSSHMVNIVHILQNVTPRSLALFDELGAGTDPTEGAALAMSILDKLGVDYTTLDETCCGSVMQRVGWPQEDVTKLMQKNVEAIKAMGVETLVLSCAGCYRMFKIEYPKYVDVPFEVLHITEYLARMDLKLKPMSGVVTYHDPCHLGRHCGVYEPPREVIAKIPGIEFKEMDFNRKTSHCCGGGGGVRSAYPEESMDIASTRLDEASFADVIITTCPFCVNNLDAAKGDRKIQVRDLVEIIDELL